MSSPGKLAILVAGGPAPGINGVIAAATIFACLDGREVIGLKDGFQWIMQGDTSHVLPLTIDRVARWHHRGGSELGISRANPTKDPALVEAAVRSLQTLGVTDVITIGGDDTAFSAMTLNAHAAGRLRVVHVPKTIDNDLDLPSYVSTFGFQTARHHGADVVERLMVDAKTTSRWYFVVAMGRTAGHLALGMGNAAGAPLSLIPEEFRKPLRLRTIVDTLAGAIIKRLSEGRADGVAVIAEGITLDIDPVDLEFLQTVERDAHGHIRLAEVNLGDLLKVQVGARLKALGLGTTIAVKNVGYELRCVDPVPFDMEYTRALGYCAAKYLSEGGTAVMVSMQAGQFVPVPFAKMLNPETGRTRVRRVDVSGVDYAIARRYMARLQRRDFEDAATLARLARTAGLSPDEFRAEFEPAIADEPAAPTLVGRG